MLQKLKRHWKVNDLNLVLILATFILGGSLCGRAAAWIIKYFPAVDRWLEIVIFVLLCTLLWPLCVILISIPLGQFAFFKRYIIRVYQRLRGIHPANASVTRIAIFASGSGTNAQRIIDHFRLSPLAKIELIACNKTGAAVLSIAAKENIPALLIEKERFYNGDAYLPELRNHHIDLIILAGFLWKIPGDLLAAYPKKIINIHPALLPKYGGPGMYGHFVHDAVIADREKESGITIHYVDEWYDQGEIIFQSRCAIDEKDTAESLSKKIQALEHAGYPAIIEKIITNS